MKNGDFPLYWYLYIGRSINSCLDMWVNIQIYTMKKKYPQDHNFAETFDNSSAEHCDLWVDFSQQERMSSLMKIEPVTAGYDTHTHSLLLKSPCCIILLHKTCCKSHCSSSNAPYYIYI